MMTLPHPPSPDPSRDALFLDFDGTLVDLAQTPDAVVVSEALKDRLLRLNAMFAGRLALISGRAISVLDGFGLPTIACAGSHGAEWRLSGEATRAMPRPDALDLAKQAFIDFATSRDGVIFEDKPLGAGLHFRLAPDHGAACISLAKSHAEGLHLQHGHAMIELRVPGVHKGTALAELMRQAPFAGYRPIFLGDDVTDEDGFVQARDDGGYGVLVGAKRDTKASYHLPGPEAVNDWLDRIVEQREAAE
ncbi:trehalose-phosphatase [Croceicoccus naphthovorans]|uniref:Trehalose 6-phosphate phosphatase n=1 Tax=Croceicoccus naphthovorans TaxID=1348774 RepID=A0A0G3XEU6_9SPHN|nr:trehalose-phosphatase [Croceicoccus naphthovorans]AKM09727.1 hypothetical protein AB433_06615 [Croceicoccus naphthovorans]MBB3990739.1 trehalose 6-phosphate phosphatase [Croceicoccus naphthovorans]